MFNVLYKCLAVNLIHGDVYCRPGMHNVVKGNDKTDEMILEAIFVVSRLQTQMIVVVQWIAAFTQLFCFRTSVTVKIQK